MKKTVKGIIGLCGVLVVMGGAFAALKITAPADSDDSSSESSEVYGEGITLIEDEEISRIDVTNESGSFSAVVLTEKTDDSAATYTIEGYEDISVTSSIVSTLANNIKGLVSDEIVSDDCEDLSVYGLDSPRITAEVTFESGETLKFEVGDVAPVTTETYFRISGETTVYTVSASKFSNYTKEPVDFISSTILAEPDDDYTIRTLNIQRQDLDYDITLEYDDLSDDENYTGGTSSTHVMTEPVSAYLSADSASDVIDGLFGLTSSGIYSVHPGEAEIAEAGLNDPFCTVTMSCDDGSEYVFLMSEPFTDEDGGKSHYAMFEGGNIIYIVSSDDAPWGTIMPIDIVSQIIVGNYVWNVSDLNVKCGDTDYTFTIAKKESDDDEDEDEDESSTVSADDFDVTLNGEKFDAERYRKFFAFLIKAPAEDMAIGETIPDGEPAVTLTVTDGYLNKTEVIEFYDYSSLKSLVVVDGESRYFCSKSYVDVLIENTDKIETDEDYIDTWK